MARIPTVIIATENGPVVINKSDFNPETMTLSETAAIEAVVPVTIHDNTAPGSVDVTVTPGELRTDGPTVAEYVERGYQATAYPPAGYASRSTADEIAAAIEAQKPKDAPPAPVAPALMLVTKQGSKYVVVDALAQPVIREGIEPAGYSSEAKAWAAVNALTAPAAS